MQQHKGLLAAQHSSVVFCRLEGLTAAGQDNVRWGSASQARTGHTVVGLAGPGEACLALSWPADQC